MLGNSIHYGKFLLVVLDSVRKVVYVMVSSDNSVALVTVETNRFELDSVVLKLVLHQYCA